RSLPGRRVAHAALGTGPLAARLIQLVRRTVASARATPWQAGAAPLGDARSVVRGVVPRPVAGGAARRYRGRTRRRGPLRAGGGCDGSRSARPRVPRARGLLRPLAPSARPAASGSLDPSGSGSSGVVRSPAWLPGGTILAGRAVRR